MIYAPLKTVIYDSIKRTVVWDFTSGNFHQTNPLLVYWFRDRSRLEQGNDSKKYCIQCEIIQNKKFYPVVLEKKMVSAILSFFKCCLLKSPVVWYLFDENFSVHCLLKQPQISKKQGLKSNRVKNIRFFLLFDPTTQDRAMSPTVLARISAPPPRPRLSGGGIYKRQCK